MERWDVVALPEGGGHLLLIKERGINFLWLGPVSGLQYPRAASRDLPGGARNRGAEVESAEDSQDFLRFLVNGSSGTLRQPSPRGFDL